MRNNGEQGKSKFLENLGCASQADASVHTNDVTAYSFDVAEGATGSKDRLLILDFPGYDDANDRVAQAYSKHYNILDAFIFIVSFMMLDSRELFGNIDSALRSGRPVLLCVNKADNAIMKKAHVDVPVERRKKVHRDFNQVPIICICQMYDLHLLPIRIYL